MLGPTLSLHRTVNWELSRATFGCRRKHIALVEDYDDVRSRVVPHRLNFCRIGRVELLQTQKGGSLCSEGGLLDKNFHGSRMANRAFNGTLTL